MSFDAFVKIDGISGESSDSKHSGWIEAIRYGTGVSQQVSTTASSAGGAGAERADVKHFNFTKNVDSSSPKLFQACAAGTHFNKILIALHRSGGSDKVKFMEYELTNCIICDVSIDGGADIFPSEKVSVNYGKIRLTYVKQSRQGGAAAGNISAGWDRERNCKI